MAGEIAQWGKRSAAKAEDPSSIPGTHAMHGKQWPVTNKIQRKIDFLKKKIKTKLHTMSDCSPVLSLILCSHRLLDALWNWYLTYSRMPWDSVSPGQLVDIPVTIIPLPLSFYLKSILSWRIIFNFRSPYLLPEVDFLSTFLGRW